MAATGLIMGKRNIQPAMVAYLDQKLATNDLAQHAIKTHDARLLLVETAKACVGIKEKTGKNDGVLVELIQKTVAGSRGQPWCMYLVQTCLAYVELKLGVKSPIYASGSCKSVWDKTANSQQVRLLPLPGAIAIWRHGKGPAGHTEITLGADEYTVICIGGNTSGTDSPGSVTREGNGVFYTRRSMQGFPRNHPSLAAMKLVGFLKPF